MAPMARLAMATLRYLLWRYLLTMAPLTMAPYYGDACLTRRVLETERGQRRKLEDTLFSLEEQLATARGHTPGAGPATCTTPHSRAAAAAKRGAPIGSPDLSRYSPVLAETPPRPPPVIVEMGSLGRNGGGSSGGGGGGGGGGGARASPARSSPARTSPGSLGNPSPSKAAQAQQERLGRPACPKRRLGGVVPQLTSRASWGRLPRLLAALRTRGEPLWAAQGAAVRRLRRLWPQSLIPRLPAPRPAARPDPRSCARPARVRRRRGRRHRRHPGVCGRRQRVRGHLGRRPPWAGRGGPG